MTRQQRTEQKQRTKYLPKSVTGADILKASLNGSQQFDVYLMLHWAALMANGELEDGFELAEEVFLQLWNRKGVDKDDIPRMWQEARTRASDNAPWMMIIDTHFEPGTDKLLRFKIEEVTPCKQ